MLRGWVLVAELGDALLAEPGGFAGRLGVESNAVGNGVPAVNTGGLVEIIFSWACYKDRRLGGFIELTSFGGFPFSFLGATLGAILAETEAGFVEDFATNDADVEHRSSSLCCTTSVDFSEERGLVPLSSPEDSMTGSYSRHSQLYHEVRGKGYTWNRGGGNVYEDFDNDSGTRTSARQPSKVGMGK